jgi:hypothetical protein
MSLLSDLQKTANLARKAGRKNITWRENARKTRLTASTNSCTHRPPSVKTPPKKPRNPWQNCIASNPPPKKTAKTSQNRLGLFWNNSPNTGKQGFLRNRKSPPRNNPGGPVATTNDVLGTLYSVLCTPLVFPRTRIPPGCLNPKECL